MNIFSYISLVILSLTGVFLIGLQESWAWALWGIGVLALLGTSLEFKKNIALIYLALAILGLADIGTDTSTKHFILLGIPMIGAIAVPYWISRYVYKDHAIDFKGLKKKNHERKYTLILIGVTLLSYFVIPYYMRDTGSYAAWVVEPNIESMIRLFIGTNSMGFWDELFFINFIFVILLRFIPFIWANLIQATLFSAFLYELGFTDWGWIMIFVFAIFQGFIFYKTRSLAYVIRMHLSIDLVLYLAIVHFKYPVFFNIFVT